MPDAPRFPPDIATDHGPRAVEVPAFPGVRLLDGAGPLRAFATADEGAADARASGPAPDAARVIAAGDLAAHAGTSARSLSQHHAEATGLTPAKGMEALRVEAARRALEEALRRSFLRRVAATPQADRARFGDGPGA